MRTVGLHGTLSCISPFVEKNQSGNAVRTVGVRIYEPKILVKTDRRSMPDGYSLYVDITGRSGAGSQYNSEISEWETDRSHRRSVLPIGGKIARGRRSRFPQHFCRRNKNRGKCRQIHLRMEESRWKVQCRVGRKGRKSDAGSAGKIRLYKRSKRISGIWIPAALGAVESDDLRQGSRTPQNAAAKGYWDVGRILFQERRVWKASADLWEPEQLFQDRYRRHLHADEGRSYEKRSVKGRI